MGENHRPPTTAFEEVRRVPELKEFITQIPIITILALLLWKYLPTWKEVRLRELEVSEKQALSMGGMAESTKQLATVMGGLASTLKSVTIEQRRATETNEILQRMNTESAEMISQSVYELKNRMGELEKTLNDKNKRTGSGAA